MGVSRILYGSVRNFIIFIIYLRASKLIRISNVFAFRLCSPPALRRAGAAFVEAIASTMQH